VQGKNYPKNKSKYHDYIDLCIKKCDELRKQRGKDYNSAMVDIPDYFPFGLTSYTQMVYLKAARLVSETEMANNNYMVDGNYREDWEHSIKRLQENLEDLMNYARFEWAFLECIKDRLYEVGSKGQK